MESWSSLYLVSGLSEHSYSTLARVRPNSQSHVVFGNLLAERMINIELFNRMEWSCLSGGFSQ